MKTTKLSANITTHCSLNYGKTKDIILPGQIIREGFKACIWLNALPPSLETTTQAFLSQPKVVFDDIYQALVRRYESSGSSKRPKLGSEVANTAMVNTPAHKGAQNNHSNKTLTCHFCKKKGR